MNTSRLLRSGSLRLMGPEELLETPASAEIEAAIAAAPWRTGFARMGALEDSRLGLIETRIQLEYLCAEAFLSDAFPSWARRRGVTTETIVRARPTARTAAGSGSSPTRSR